MRSLLRNNKKFGLLLAVIIAGGLVFWLSPAEAAGSVAEYVTMAMAAIISNFIWLVGRLLTVIIYILMWIVQYNDFINSAAVNAGWGIVRDICNMFFILILLVIAFSTTINQGNFKMTQALPKLVLAAILINFSKLICGVIIDFAQVVMLTFVNGFRDIGAGNFASLFSLSQLLKIDPQGTTDAINLFSLLGSYLLALVYLIVAIVVVTVIVFILIMRMVMLWILIVLSPLPWLLGVAPATKRYGDKWWNMFIDNVISGPLLAFFIWLSFAAISVGSTGQTIVGENTKPPGLGTNEQEYVNSIPKVGLSEVGNPDNMLKFLISIGLLVGGLMITKELSGAVGQIAGKGLGAINKMGSWAQKGGITVAKNTGRLAGQKALSLAGSSVTGLNKLVGGSETGSLAKTGGFIKSWAGDIAHTRQHEKEEGRKKVLEKIGMKAETMDKLAEAAKTPLGRSVKGAAMFGLGALSGNPVMMAAGTAHLAFVHSQEMVGGAIQSFAGLMQRGLNHKNAMDDTFNAKGKMSERYRERENKQEELDKNKTDETKSLDVKKAKDLKDAAGKPQAELDKIETAYAQEYQKITDKYKNLAQVADSDYQRKATDVQKTNDQQHEGAYVAAKAKEEKAWSDIVPLGDRRRKISQAKKDYKRDASSLDALKREELRAAKQKYGNDSDSLRLESDKINARYANEQAELKAGRENNIKSANAEFFSRTKVPMTNMLTRGINKAGQGIKGFETNNLTIKAAELGSKQVKRARQFVSNIADEGFAGTTKEALSTKEGINQDQEYFYKELGHNSTGMKAVIDHVRKLKTDGWDNDEKKMEKQKDVMDSLKKGIANFHDKTHNHHEGEFATLVTELNDLDTGNRKKAVSDWAPTGGHGHGGHDDHGHGDDHGGGHHEEGTSWVGGGGDDHGHDGGGHH